MTVLRVLIGDGGATAEPLGRSRGAAGLRRMLGAARLALHPDGRALLLPAPGHVADDLVPLSGRWSEDGTGARSVSVSRAPEPWRAVTLTAVLRGTRLTGRHELVDGDDVHRHDVVVPLTDDPSALARAGVVDVDGVPAPVVLSGSLSGRCGDTPFDAVDVELAVLDPHPGATRSLEVSLSAHDHLRVGGVLWLGGPAGTDEEDTGLLSVDVHGGRIRMTTDAPSGAAFTCTFTAPPDGAFDVGVPGWAPPPGFGALGVAVVARRAELDVRVRRSGREVRATGSLRMSGLLPNRAVDLTATLDATGSLPDPGDLDADGFRRRYRTQDP